jgi:hypothetical protein
MLTPIHDNSYRIMRTEGCIGRVAVLGVCEQVGASPAEIRLG